MKYHILSCLAACSLFNFVQADGYRGYYNSPGYYSGGYSYSSPQYYSGNYYDGYNRGYNGGYYSNQSYSYPSYGRNYYNDRNSYSYSYPSYSGESYSGGYSYNPGYSGRSYYTEGQGGSYSQNYNCPGCPGGGYSEGIDVQVMSTPESGEQGYFEGGRRNYSDYQRTGEYQTQSQRGDQRFYSNRDQMNQDNRYGYGTRVDENAQGYNQNQDRYATQDNRYSDQNQNYMNDRTSNYSQNQNRYNTQDNRYNDQNRNYMNDANASSYNQNRDGNSDNEIQKRIKDSLSSGVFTKGYDQVRYQVNGGNVILSGTVPTTDDKVKVEKNVKSIDGVRNVNNMINVSQNVAYEDNAYPYSSSNWADNRDNRADNTDRKSFSQDQFANQNDQMLNKRIREKISEGWLWNSYTDIKLNTNNGVVTLEGMVNSPKDEQDLIDKIRKIEGVRQVQSRLQIKQNR